MLPLRSARVAQAAHRRPGGDLPLSAAVIAADGVEYAYGAGALRRQVLFDVDLEIQAGEVVIMTGPSGSGKTTLLTLLGALRTPQAGRLRILGRELTGAAPALLREVRRSIGYVFQSHNLLDSLSARQNVEMALALDPGGTSSRDAARALEMLRQVGLEEHAERRPDALSGGQRQRVAVARALAAQPRILLADEPTASLDRDSGRQVVDLIDRLARRDGCAVLLVTHDNRVLDVADRLLHIEDGRLASFTSACTTSARRMLDALARTARKGELTQRVRGLDVAGFQGLLAEVTEEFETFLRVLALSRSSAFDSMLDQVLESFTSKIAELLRAERVSLFVVDEERQELWTKITSGASTIRMPLGAGIAGTVARTGLPLNIADAYADPRFNPEIDRETGFRTRNLLCMPLQKREGGVFAVMQLLNKIGAPAFGEDDEAVFVEFARRMGVILEAWTSQHALRGDLAIGA